MYTPSLGNKVQKRQKPVNVGEGVRACVLVFEERLGEGICSECGYLFSKNPNEKCRKKIVTEALR